MAAFTSKVTFSTRCFLDTQDEFVDGLVIDAHRRGDVVYGRTSRTHFATLFGIVKRISFSGSAASTKRVFHRMAIRAKCLAIFNIVRRPAVAAMGFVMSHNNQRLAQPAPLAGVAITPLNRFFPRVNAGRLLAFRQCLTGSCLGLSPRPNAEAPCLVPHANMTTPKKRCHGFSSLRRIIAPKNTNLVFSPRILPYLRWLFQSLGLVVDTAQRASKPTRSLFTAKLREVAVQKFNLLRCPLFHSQQISTCWNIIPQKGE